MREEVRGAGHPGRAGEGWAHANGGGEGRVRGGATGGSRAPRRWPPAAGEPEVARAFRDGSGPARAGDWGFRRFDRPRPSR